MRLPWRLGSMLALLTAVASALAAAQPPAQQPGQVRWNVVAGGAVGDGRQDNTAIFQRLLDAAHQAGGGIVEVPAGRFVIRGELSVPAGVTLQGAYRIPPTIDRNRAGELSGSVLLAFANRGKPEGPPFIRLAGNNAALAGLVVSYPEWKQADVPPIPYPPCVASQDTENVGISECLFVNPYEGIRLIRAHRHLVRNVTGYPIKRGIHVDECYDIGHIENVHLWPFGVTYKPDDPYCRWINTEGVAFELARTDWHYVHNTFCFGYGVGYKFAESRHGSTNGNFLGLGADSCQRAVVVDQVQPPGLLITNGEFVGRWSSKDAVCLDIGPQVAGKVSLVNCSFWGPIDRCVWMRAPRGQFTANACHFVQWDIASVGSPALQVDAGRAIIQGNTFNQEGPHVLIGDDKVVSVLLIGNQAAGGFIAENRAGRRTQMLANEPTWLDSNANAVQHYRIAIGMRGDGAFLQGWHNRERVGNQGPRRTMRWSKPKAKLRLPVAPGAAYSLTLDLEVPVAAVADGAGLYLDGKRLVSFTPGVATLTVELPASRGSHVELEIVCQGWKPPPAPSGARDDRTLGITLFAVTMRASKAVDQVFEVNARDVK